MVRAGRAVGPSGPVCALPAEALVPRAVRAVPDDLVPPDDRLLAGDVPLLDFRVLLVVLVLPDEVLPLDDRLLAGDVPLLVFRVLPAVPVLREVRLPPDALLPPDVSALADVLLLPDVRARPDALLPDGAWAGSEPAFPLSAGCGGRGWVSQATAAPVRATGHSTTPAAPSIPAPAYTAMRRPRGETTPTLSSVSSAALVTVPAPGTLRSAEAAPRRGAVRADDFCSAMTLLG
ncbi:hypothetical protein [Streptomyces sp. NRAIS3]